MEQIEISIDDFDCEENERNNIEIDYWKKIFIDRKPIPSPYIDSNKKVIAFSNCFFALKDLGLSKIYCVLID